jgi:hypothetical protein
MVTPDTVAPLYHVPEICPDRVYWLRPLAGLKCDHVTGPLNVPAKMVPFGTPFVPLPVMVKVPPAANVALPVKGRALVSAPVVKLTVPMFPVSRPPPFKPLTTTNSEPVRVKPAELPERVPALFVKSTGLSANAARGRANASKDINTIRFIITIFLLNLCKTQLIVQPPV